LNEESATIDSYAFIGKPGCTLRCRTDVAQDSSGKFDNSQTHPENEPGPSRPLGNFSTTTRHQYYRVGIRVEGDVVMERSIVETVAMRTPKRVQTIVLAGLCCLACFLPGCQTARLSAPPVRHLVEGFEQCGLWSIDSANNFGEVRYILDKATSGEYALEATFYNSGRANTIFRKEVDYDLSGTQNLWLDVMNTNAQPGGACALAFRTERGAVFETKPAELIPGWNMDVRFRLDRGGMASGTDLASWTGQCGRVTRVMIYAFPGNNTRGALCVDNLRGDSLGINRKPRPQLYGVQSPTGAVPQGEPVEVMLTFNSASLQKGEYDPKGSGTGTWAPARVMARLTSPDGVATDVNGFLKEADPERNNLLYALRFTPDTAGQWHIAMGYWAERKWQDVWQQTFTVLPAGNNPACIIVDSEDPSCFALASGKPFYPIGQNICWAGDYGPYLRRIQQYGGNLVRIWICPWNFPLLTKDVDSIDLTAAAEIDRVLKLARECGIYVQLVLSYHGWFKDDWARNPFNAELGGPLTRAQDFWHDAEARRAFKSYLDYVVRRWSACPNVFAWELMNEVDLVPYDMEQDVVEWHREMAEHLKSIDPAKHLVTTSVSGSGALTGIWELASIDFCTSHMYSPDVDDSILGAWRVFASCGKPYFIGEIGRGCRPADDQVDPEGNHLHHALWLAWMTPSAGNCLPWWWDTHIRPNRLERHYEPLVAFNRGEDRRGKHFRGRTAHWQEKDGSTVRFQGLVTRQSVYGFVYSRESFTQVGPLRVAPLSLQHRSLEFTNMEEGPYELEMWDTYTGTITRLLRLTCVDSRLLVTLPPASRDFAFKVKQAATFPPPPIAVPDRQIEREKNVTKSLLSGRSAYDDSSPAIAGESWGLPIRMEERK